MEYPKIETLYNRGDNFKVDTTAIREAEFELIKRWLVTEKIDGTNIRVTWHSDTKQVTLGGRTDNALIYSPLVTYLHKIFTVDKFSEIAEFADSDVILFGEGYGPKIQKGGGNYRADVSFRLFDVRVGDWWLEPVTMSDVASCLGCSTVPSHGFIEDLPRSADELRLITGNISATSTADGGPGCQPEGIVARPWPLLLDRAGRRVMWKLKFKDF